MPRSLRRFYVDRALSREGDLIELSSRETFHLQRVLRLKPGDACQLFNEKGRGAEGLIETLSEAGAKLRLQKIYPLKKRNLLIKVAQALPQKKKMDELVDRAEELSVAELWVMETERTVVKMKSEACASAQKRWKRIGIEAAKQSGSPGLMKIEGPVPFEKALEAKSPKDRSYIFHLDPDGLSFSQMVEEIRSAPSVFLFFGPEGGFTEEEIRWAESKGIQKVFLGEFILRLETAFVGVLSSLRFLIP